jgi:hypothetical protein
MVKHAIKLTIIVVLIGNSATFFAASGEKDKQNVEPTEKFIMKAIRGNDLAGITQLFEQGKLNPNQKFDGIPLIFKAITSIKKRPEIVALLIESGADVNARREDSNTTPLDIAYSAYNMLSELPAEKDQEQKDQLGKIIDRLLEAGAKTAIIIAEEEKKSAALTLSRTSAIGGFFPVKKPWISRSDKRN